MSLRHASVLALALTLLAACQPWYRDDLLRGRRAQREGPSTEPDFVAPPPARRAAAAGEPVVPELVRAAALASTDAREALAIYNSWLNSWGEPDHPALRRMRDQVVAAAWADPGINAVLTALIRRADQAAAAGHVEVALALYSLAYRQVPTAVFEAHAASFLRAAAAAADPAAVDPLAGYLAAQGDIALKEGRLDAAIRRYRRAVAIAPWWRAAHHNLAILFYMSGRSDEARLQRAWVRRLLAPPPAPASPVVTAAPVDDKAAPCDDPDACEQANSASSEDNATPAAASSPAGPSESESASESDEEKAARYFKQGDAYFRTGSYDRAIEEYEKGYADLPKPGFLFNIGLAYEKLGNQRRAIEYYRRYLTEAPDGRAGNEARARAEALERAIAEDEAVAAERERVANEGKRRDAEASAHRKRAQSLAAAGELDDAVAELRAAYALTEEPELLWEMGELHDRRGDPAAAVVEYERYRQVAPAGPHSREAVRRVEVDKAALQRAATVAKASPGRASWSVQSRTSMAYQLDEKQIEPLASFRTLVGRVSRTGWALLGQVGYTASFDDNETPGELKALHFGLSLSQVGNGRLMLSPSVYAAAVLVTGERASGEKIDSELGVRFGNSLDIRLAVTSRFDVGLTFEVFATPPLGTSRPHVAAGAGLLLDLHQTRPVRRGFVASGDSGLWIGCVLGAASMVILPLVIKTNSEEPDFVGPGAL